jgi:hypothetical protein
MRRAFTLALFSFSSVLAALVASSCSANYDHIGVPPPETRHGIRVRVSGTERGPLGQFHAVHGEAVNDTGEALSSCELRFTGLDFSAEKIGTAVARCGAWSPGGVWKFRAAFPAPGVSDLRDVTFEGVSYELAPAPRGAR